MKSQVGSMLQDMTDINSYSANVDCISNVEMNFISQIGSLTSTAKIQDGLVESREDF